MIPGYDFQDIVDYIHHPKEFIHANAYRNYMNILGEEHSMELADDLNARVEMIIEEKRLVRKNKQKKYVLFFVFFLFVGFWFVFTLINQSFTAFGSIPVVLILIVLYTWLEIQAKSRNTYGEEREILRLRYWLLNELGQEEE